MTRTATASAGNRSGQARFSNRDQIDQNLVVTPQQGVGIDTVDVSGAVSDEVLAAVPRLKMQPVDLRRPDGTPVRAHVRLSRARGEPRLTASFSVATWHRGNNATPGSTSEAVEAIAEFYECAKGLVEWRVPSWEWLDVSRCDIARDFVGVTNPLGLLDAISYVRPERAKTLVWRDRACKGTESLYREANGWKTRLYSRDALASKRKSEARLDRDRGRLRFEVELRGEHLRDAGIARAWDLERVDVARVAAYYWTRSRFGAPVNVEAAGAHATDRVTALRAAPRTERTRIGTALGQLQLEQYGVDHRRAPDTRRAIEATAAKYGLRQMLQGEVTSTARLDLESGRLLLGD